MDRCEVYVLCGARTATLGETFLDAFLPGRREVADDYPVPELVDAPSIVLQDAPSLLRHLEQHPGEGYAVHWTRVGAGDPAHALLVFTTDGGMIAGLVTSRPDPGALMQALADLVGGAFGMTELECRPPETGEAFVLACRRAVGPRMISGRLHDA